MASSILRFLAEPTQSHNRFSTLSLQVGPCLHCVQILLPALLAYAAPLIWKSYADMQLMLLRYAQERQNIGDYVAATGHNIETLLSYVYTGLISSCKL